MMLNFITKAQDHGRAARRAKRRLRPTVMALEGRTLLSAFTADRAADGVSARMLQWATGQANVHNEADTIVCSSLFSTRKAILARRGPSNPRSTGPILVDGFIVSVAALAASRINPSCRPYLVFSHRSAEQGHRLVLEALAARPLLDLDLRLGEGSGAALALPILRLACALHNGMATFAEAAVPDRPD